MSKQQFISALQAAELRDQDKYPPFDANSIELDRLSQWIEEEATYTNFIVLKGIMRIDRVEFLTARHYNVQSLKTDSGGITIVQWPTI